MYGFGACSAGNVMFSPIDLAPTSYGAAVGRLHDSRPATGDNHVVAFAVDLAVGRDQPGKFTRRIVVATLGHDATPSARPRADIADHRATFRAPRAPPANASPPPATRPPECHRTRRWSIRRLRCVKPISGLEQLQLDPYRAGLPLLQELGIVLHRQVAGRLEDCLQVLRLVRWVEPFPFSPIPQVERIPEPARTTP